MKKKREIWFRYGDEMRLLFRKMKLTAILLFIVFVTFGNSFSQVRLTVHFDKSNIRDVLQTIEQKTDYIFLYKDQIFDFSQQISADFTDANFEEILKDFCNQTNVTYEVRDRQIILKEKEAPVSRQLGQQQKKTITGRVTDEAGMPLPGVSIVIKGTTIGVITDANGNYTLVYTGEAKVLSFSFVGMKKQEITVGNKASISIVMENETVGVEEVVVVGYGEQKKETVTGSVTSVKMSTLRTPVPTLTNALAGKVAGIISMQTSGEPGYDHSNFTIRGIGTFTGNNSPLIIIDGVQRDDANSTYAGAYNNIDPEDIQSISLLKDASATAVYGAKGANGVLIITTKKGSAGKPKISVKAESGMSGLTRIPKMLDGVTYMKLYNEAKTNMGESAIYSDERIQKTASGLDPYLYPNVNWIKLIYKDWAQMHNANININGGAEAVRYYVSMSFYNQEGNYKVSNMDGYNPNINFKRYDFRSNVDVDLTKTTELSVNLAAMLVNSRYPGVSSSSIWYSAYATNPISFPSRYPDGKWAGPLNNGGTNPLNQVQNSGYTTEFRPTMQSILSLKQKLDFVTKGLSVSGRFSFDSYGQNDNSRTGTNDLWYAGSRDGNGNLVYAQTRYGAESLGYSQYSSAERTMYLETNINYSRTFGSHTLGGLLLYNMRNRIQSTAGTVIGSIPYRNQGLAGRIMYSYKDKYLAEVNAGYTGSENFASGNRFGFFPSISGGWVISSESFFAPYTKSVNLLKLRASYGLVGNDQIGGTGARFPYLTQINGSTGTSFGYSPTYYGGISESLLGVENLTWETSTKTNLGIELGLFKKFNLVLEAYQDNRKDILIPRGSISPIAGYSGLEIYANMGDMNNKGLDGSIEYNGNIGKDVTLRVFSNFTYSKNKIVFQDEPKRSLSYQQGTGHRFGEFTGYISEGLFVDQADIDASPRQTFGITRPGDIKYKDMNNDGTIDASDWTYLGKSAFPTFSYGFGFSIGYKKIDLSLFFQGVADASIMANGSGIKGNNMGSDGVGVVPFAGMGQYPGNILSNVTNRWTVENPSQNVDYPRLSIATQSDNNYQSSTWWMKEGSFCRLKQASLGYTLFSSEDKKMGISNLYFYLSGQNLLTFSKFKLWDPELGSGGAGYPPVRTISLGIRAQF